jgi:integrase
MAAISPVLRKVNKGTEQPVYVRYYHAENGKYKDYFAPVGFSVNPAHFKAGKVVGIEIAPEANAKIQAVVNGLEQAVRLASAGNGEPTASKVKGLYLALPALNSHKERIATDWKAFGKNKIEILQHEIEELRATIAAKEAQIQQLQLQTGTFKPVLLSQLITDYVTHRNNEKPKASAGKKRKNSFSKSTQFQYEQLRNQLIKFDSALSIKDIDKKKLQEIESYFVAERYYNTSTFTLINKLIAVLNHYQPIYELGKDYKGYTFELPMREESVIYLTTEELTAFRNVNTNHKHSLARKAAERTKDLALLMSETALRYSDSAITRTDIVGGYIVKNQQKTGGRVQIPFTSRLQAICEKYDYTLKGGKIDGFNATFRRLLSTLNVSSLHEDVTVTNYIGEEAVTDTRKKYEHCGAHTLRRTMINQCLLRNLRYDKITRITGHKDFDTFQTYIDRDTKVAEMDTVFDFLNAEIEKPVMRVA